MLFAALLVMQGVPLPEMTLTTVAGGGKVTVSEFPESRSDAVMARIAEMAKVQCHGLATRWGRFNTAQVTRVGTDGESQTFYTQYVQKFSCIDPKTDPFKPVATDWLPSDADKTDAIVFAERQLSAMSRGDVASTMAGFEPLLELTPADTKTTVDDFRSRTKGQTWKFRPTVWLNNPEAASHPGAYAYSVFDTPRACGYLLLYRTGAGTYQLAQFRVLGQLADMTWTEDSARLIREQCSKL